MIQIHSFRDVLRLFFIYKKEFRRAVIVTVIVAVLGAFLLPPRYRSDALMLVKPGRENATLPIEVSNRQALLSPVTQRDPVTDEEKMLTGHHIVLKVAERYLEETANMPPPKSAWKRFKQQFKKVIGEGLEGLRRGFIMIGIVEDQPLAERVASKLKKSFSVSHEGGSSVMELSFTWDDPHIAQAVLAAWIDAYHEERRRVLGNPTLYEFYESQGQKTADALDGYKSQLARLQNSVQAVDVRRKLENLTDRIETLDAQRTDASAELASLRAGERVTRSNLAQVPAEVSKERQVGLNPVQLDLKNRLNELEVQRAALLKTFLPDAQPVRELDETIAAVKKQIAALPEKTLLSQNFAQNSVAVSLKQGVLDRQTRVNELEALIADKNRQIRELMTERRKVLDLEHKAVALQRQLEAAEKNYLLYTDSLEKARIDRELDLNRISNIAVVEEATFSPARVFPKSLGILLAALPAGLLIGCVVVYLCFLIDQRIHDGGRVREVFEVPLWTSLPDAGETGLAQARFSASLLRLHNLLPMDRLAAGLTVGLTSARHGEGVSFVAEALARSLTQRGVPARVALQGEAAPGEVLVLDCPALLHEETPLLSLPRADIILLVVEATRTTVPTVKQALQVLQLGFNKVDGIVINRRRFEIPVRVMRWLGYDAAAIPG